MSPNPENEEILEKLDLARTGRFHIKAIIVSGMGFFSDAYDLFVISTAIPVIAYAFNITATNNIFGTAFVGPLQASSVETGLIGAMALFGAFVGAMIFGRIADIRGRKYTYGIEMAILVVFAIVSAFSVNVYMLMISRFILGVGVGGDYPISSTIMSEYSSIRNRGKMVLSVFSMQGFGLLTGAIVGIAAVHFFSLDMAWRFMLGFGAVPAASVIYLRRKIKETPRFSLQIKGDVGAAKAAVEDVTGKAGKETVRESPPPSSRTVGEKILRKYWVVILGTAGSWFLFDMAFYGTSVNSGLILHQIGYGSVPGDIKATIFNIAVGNAILAGIFAIPGYWIAVGLVDRVGRKALQWLGFTAMAIIYFIFAINYVGIKEDFLLFISLYGLSYLFGNIGPNSTTFLLPTELFPTQIRTTGHGIAASAGKLGAGIFTFLEPILYALNGPSTVFALLSGFSVIAVLLTLFTIEETKNRSLETISLKMDGRK